MKKMNESGFTLVELLAVIVVLALLMVVAASSIGSSLDNAKQSSMKTEGEKIVSKTYEDLKMQEVDATFGFTYLKTITPTTGTPTNGSGTDGSYNFKITFTEGKMSTICIDDGKNKYDGTISEAEVTWGDFTKSSTC